MQRGECTRLTKSDIDFSEEKRIIVKFKTEDLDSTTLKFIYELLDRFIENFAKEIITEERNVEVNIDELEFCFPFNIDIDKVYLRNIDGEFFTTLSYNIYNTPDENFAWVTKYVCMTSAKNFGFIISLSNELYKSILAECYEELKNNRYKSYIDLSDFDERDTEGKVKLIIDWND